MAKQTLNNGETGLAFRGKLNSMMTELYDAIVNLLPANADAIADVLEGAVTTDPTSLERIKHSVSGVELNAQGDLVLLGESGAVVPVTKTVTWATKPLGGVGVFLVSDVGIGGSLWVGDGSTYKPLGQITLMEYVYSGTAVTGTTARQDVAAVALPAGVLVGRSVAIEVGCDATSNANTKLFETLIGGTVVTYSQIKNAGGTLFHFRGKASGADRMRFGAYGNPDGMGYGGSSSHNPVIDLTQALDIKLSITLSDPGDSASYWFGGVYLR